MTYPYCKCDSFLIHNAGSDMLAALRRAQTMLTIVRDHGELQCSETLAAVRAAIAKATDPDWESRGVSSAQSAKE